jgi:hypothetical protein
VTTSSYSVGLYDNRILLRAACSSVQLPSVAAWVEAQSPVGQNWAGFTREIWIKDYAQAASVASPVVVTPFGSDQIDLLSSYSISTPGELLRLVPLTDLSGWFVS